MPGSDSSQKDFNPQHRIVGAIILVIAAIVVVPMVLEEEQLDSQKSGSDFKLTDKDAKVYVSKAEDIRRAQNEKLIKKIQPETNQQSIKSVTPPAIKSSPVEAVAKPAKEQPEQEKPKTAKTKPAPEKEKQVARVDKIIKKGWVVQIGTYSDSANAKKVRASLIRHGHHVRLEKVKLPKGKATRVRVGPFSDRGKAITTMSRIERDIGLQGVVLKYP